MYGDTGSTPKDQNKVENDKMSKVIHATAMKEDDVPFILFGETKDNIFIGFTGLLENGYTATIERLHYMPKHEYEFRAKVWNS